MTELLFLSTFIFGLLIGSFLNVVILRYNTGHSISHGRSACLSCQSGLQWYELLPVVSFVALRGRCRTCKVKIRAQYPLVELATGLLFFCIALRAFALETTFVVASSVMLFYWIIAALLVVIFVYDLYHKIIPDVLVYSFIAFSLLQVFVTIAQDGLLFVLPHMYALIAGPVVALPFFLLWALSRGTWMGFGDVKLALGIGWLLGVSLGFSAIILAFWIGAVVSLGILVWQKVASRGRLTFKSEIPFAPFLIVGLGITAFFPFDFLMIGGYIASLLY